MTPAPHGGPSQCSCHSSVPVLVSLSVSHSSGQAQAIKPPRCFHQIAPLYMFVCGWRTVKVGTVETETLAVERKKKRKIYTSRQVKWQRDWERWQLKGWELRGSRLKGRERERERGVERERLPNFYFYFIESEIQLFRKKIVGGQERLQGVKGELFFFFFSIEKRWKRESGRGIWLSLPVIT